MCVIEELQGVYLNIFAKQMCNNKLFRIVHNIIKTLKFIEFNVAASIWFM